jgi:peptidoglycan hydrolase-like protein with peptidoglycan-binding domain
LLGCAIVTAGCSSGDPEAHAREALERMKASVVNVEQKAMEQKVDSAVVQKTQEQLTKLFEYMGPIDGQLDMVTVNAIEAFQRSHDMRANGLLTGETLQELDKATAGKG